LDWIGLDCIALHWELVSGGMSPLRNPPVEEEVAGLHFLGDQAEEEVIFDNQAETAFDRIVGAIEDIVIDDQFQDLQTDLLEKHFHHFDNSEENKLIYTDIFNEYTVEIEKYIEAALVQKVPDFHMDIFLEELNEKRNELDGDIFEMLYTLSDFMAFKELFVDYSMMKRSPGCDLSDLLCVSALPI